MIRWNRNNLLIVKLINNLLRVDIHQQKLMKITMFSSDQTQTRSPRWAADRKHIFRMHRDVRIEMRIVCRVNAQTSWTEVTWRPFFPSFILSFFFQYKLPEVASIRTSVGAVSTHRYIRSIVDFSIRGKKIMLDEILVKNLMEEI